jgi:hypothetical protein
MKNRAKCKLCQSVIESFHKFDLVSCKCGEISISGGLDAYEAAAMNWNNFLRIDDQNNEIVVKVEGNHPLIKIQEIPSTKPNRKELLSMLDEMIKSIENLPDHAKYSSVNQYDLYSFMLLMSSILKSESDN